MSELHQLFNMSSADIAWNMKNMLSHYKFTPIQNEQLINNREKFTKFADLDSKIINGVIKNVENPTAYIASILFKNK
jgi:hypothetical protein